LENPEDCFAPRAAAAANLRQQAVRGSGTVKSSFYSDMAEYFCG
jgi:hypothetical protein